MLGFSVDEIQGFVENSQASIWRGGEVSSFQSQANLKTKDSFAGGAIISDSEDPVNWIT